MEKNKGFSRDFWLVVAGQIISLFGNAVMRFALPLHLLDCIWICLSSAGSDGSAWRNYRR